MKGAEERRAAGRRTSNARREAVRVALEELPMARQVERDDQRREEVVYVLVVSWGGAGRAGEDWSEGGKADKGAKGRARAAGCGR